MIARLDLGPGGPELSRIRRFGPPRTLIVVVSDELSAPDRGDDWPIEPIATADATGNRSMRARVGGERLVAPVRLRAIVLRQATTRLPSGADARDRRPRALRIAPGFGREPSLGRRTLLVPEAALRERRRPLLGRGGGGCVLRLRVFGLRVFRRPVDPRTGALVALLAATVASAATGGLFLQSALQARVELAALEGEHEALLTARSALEALDAQRLRMDAPPSHGATVGVPPARLVSALASLLEPEERIVSLHLDAEGFSLVTDSRRTATLAEAVAELPGVTGVAHTSTRSAEGSTTSVRGRIGGPQ